MSNPDNNREGGVPLSDNLNAEGDKQLFSPAGAAAFNSIIDETIAYGCDASVDFDGDEPDYGRIFDDSEEGQRRDPNTD
jgi:hypothetical protein